MSLVLSAGTSQALTQVFPDPLTLAETRSPLPAFKNLGRGVF